jgi:hypothetical protein
MIYLFIILFLLFSIITGILNASEDKFNFHWHKSIFVKIDEYWKIRLRILFITTYTVCSHIMRNITFSFFFNKILNGNK